MYDYMAFLFVGIVVLSVGMLLGTTLANHSDSHAEIPADEDDVVSTHHASEVSDTTSHPEVDAIKAEFANYRAKVNQHFIETEQAIDALTEGYQKTLEHVLESEYSTPTRELVHDLTQSYQHVFSTLCDGAKGLVEDSATLQRLDARRDKTVLINTQQRINKA